MGGARCPMIASITGPGAQNGPDRWVTEGEVSDPMGRWRRMRETGEWQVGRRGRWEQEVRPG